MSYCQPGDQGQLCLINKLRALGNKNCIVMVYPKNHTRAKNGNRTGSISIGSNLNQADEEIVSTEMSDTKINQECQRMSYQALAAICDMMENYNVIIANFGSSIKKLEETNARNASKREADFDMLFSRIDEIERHLGSAGVQIKRSPQDSEGLTNDISTVSPLGVIEQRVFDIEQLILRSCKRRRVTK